MFTCCIFGKPGCRWMREWGKCTVQILILNMHSMMMITFTSFYYLSILCVMLNLIGILLKVEKIKEQFPYHSTNIWIFNVGLCAHISMENQMDLFKRKFVHVAIWIFLSNTTFLQPNYNYGLPCHCAWLTELNICKVAIWNHQTDFI